MTAASSICSAIKADNPRRKVLLVGGHVAALPRRTLEEVAADFVATGEGPVTLFEILQALRSNSDELSRVHGLGYRENDHIAFTTPAPLVRDLDHEMAALAWDLLPMDKYRAHNWHCFGDLDRQPLRVILHHVWLSFSMQLLLHPGPVQERRETCRLEGERQ